MYKVVNGMSPEIMNDIFKLRENTHYNLRHTPQFLVDPIRSVFNLMVVNQHHIWDPKFGNKYPSKLKTINSLVGFKKEIRKWKPANCPCRIYTFYIPSLGFI